MDSVGQAQVSCLKYLPAHKEQKYPNLRTHGYRVTSETTEYKYQKYNCVALAADGDFTIWWEPSTLNSKPVKRPGRYWPDGIATDGSVESYVKLYELLGYQKCDSGKLELLYEKIVIYGYTPEEAFSHVAYQLYSGWISKLGDMEDIKHRTPEALVSEDYGDIKVFMKRQCNLRGFLARAFFNTIAKRWPVKKSVS
jgi:hypothetical protein